MIRDTSCCGLDEFHGFYMYNNYKTLIRQITRDTETPFILFTDTENKHKINGEGLAAFIKENKLGNVKKTPYRINRNSDNNLRCYLWTINRGECRKLRGK